MSWMKNGMLLLAGGAIGICLAAMVQASIEEDNRRNHENDDVLPDGIDLLMSKIRYEAEVAMESCSSDEERSTVYEQIKESIYEIQEKLRKRGEEMIAALQEQSQGLGTSVEGRQIPAWMNRSDGEAPPIPKWMLKDEKDGVKTVQPHVQGIKTAMQKMSDALEETLDSLKPEQKPSLSQA